MDEKAFDMLLRQVFLVIMQLINYGLYFFPFFFLYSFSPSDNECQITSINIYTEIDEAVQPLARLRCHSLPF
jgi:hypothetical protein